MKQRRGIWLIVGIVVVGFILAVVIAVVAAVILGSQVTAQEPSPVPSVAVTATSLSVTPTEAATDSPVEPTTVVEPTVAPTVEVVPTEVPEPTPGDEALMTVVDIWSNEAVDMLYVQVEVHNWPSTKPPQVWVSTKFLRGVKAVPLGGGSFRLEIGYPGAYAHNFSWELRLENEVVGTCELYDLDEFYEFGETPLVKGDCVWKVPDRP